MSPAVTPTVMRLVGWTACASGVIAATGLVFLIAMFASFAVDAQSSGMVFGWVNDVLVTVSYLLAAPTAIALGALHRRHAPVVGGLVTIIGIIGITAITAIVILQLLLAVGALTFEAQIGSLSIALLVLAVWFVTTGYLGSSSGDLPHGVRMGLLAATYVGYPIWALWVGRRLFHLADDAAGASANLRSQAKGR